MSVVINPTVATVGRSVTARYFGTGDGSRVAFNLAGLDSDRAYLMPVLYLDQTLQTVTTHYTVDATGKVTFVTAPAAGKVVNYKDPWAPSGNIYRAFGMGDGTSVDFSLPFVPKVPVLYRNDWQGNQQLYSTARTNSVLHSESLGTGWGLGDVTISSDVATPLAPDGAQTADKIVEGTGGGYHHVYQTLTLTPGTNHFRFYAYPGERTFLDFELDAGYGFVNLVTGTLGFNIGLSNLTTVKRADGWVEINFDQTTGATALIDFYTEITLGNSVYTGDGASGLYLTKIQSCPGAYIPTTTAAVTTTDYTYTPNGDVTMGVAPVVGAILTADMNFGPQP